MQPWLIGWCLALMLIVLGDAYGDKRGRGRESQDFPFSSEHWDGWRKWTPDRRTRRQGLPDQFTIDKRGKCEVYCERVGRSYRCKEYRC